MNKKLLQDNKRAWHTKLKFSLWDERISTKKAFGTSPFQLIYGLYVIFPAYLVLPIMKYLQEQESEQNSIQRRMNQLIEVQQVKESVYDRSQLIQDIMKKIFDRKIKAYDFQLGDLVLKWDARFEDKGKHGKFDHLWQGPYKISSLNGKNAYFLQDSNGNKVTLGPLNVKFLKHYLT